MTTIMHYIDLVFGVFLFVMVYAVPLALAAFASYLAMFFTMIFYAWLFNRIDKPKAHRLEIALAWFLLALYMALIGHFAISAFTGMLRNAWWIGAVCGKV